MDMMAKGPNDGSLLLLVEVNAQLVVNNTLFKNVSNDPVRDLSPVSMAVRASHFPVTHPPLPVRNVQEFIADVKANHGFLYASVGLGGASHRTMEMFRFVNEAIRSSPAFYAQMLRKVPGKVFGLARSGLGFSGGAALGVQLAHSNRMVVQVTGDGSHYYDNPEALYGVAQPKRVPVFSMILDNIGWGAVKAATLHVYPDGPVKAADTFPTRLPPSTDFAAYARRGCPRRTPGARQRGPGCDRTVRRYGAVGLSALLHVRSSPVRTIPRAPIRHGAAGRKDT